MDITQYGAQNRQLTPRKIITAAEGMSQAATSDMQGNEINTNK